MNRRHFFATVAALPLIPMAKPAETLAENELRELPSFKMSSPPGRAYLWWADRNGEIIDD